MGSYWKKFGELGGVAFAYRKFSRYYKSKGNTKKEKHYIDLFEKYAKKRSDREDIEMIYKNI